MIDDANDGKKAVVTIKQRIVANRARLYGKLALAICTFITKTYPR
jgi:hypothetical protein